MKIENQMPLMMYETIRHNPDLIEKAVGKSDDQAAEQTAAVENNKVAETDESNRKEPKGIVSSDKVDVKA